MRYFSEKNVGCDAIFDAMRLPSLLFLNQFPKTVDVICLSETRLTDRNVSFRDNIADYHLF